MKVEIQFTKGATVTYRNVPASTTEEAKDKALKSARAEGFKNPVKKIIVKEED